MGKKLTKMTEESMFTEYNVPTPNKPISNNNAGVVGTPPFTGIGSVSGWGVNPQGVYVTCPNCSCRNIHSNYEAGTYRMCGRCGTNYALP